MFVTFTSDFVLFLYKHHLILIAGIAAALILSKYKVCWLAYLAGLVGEFLPILNDYVLLSRAFYGYAMSGVLGGFVIVAVIGAIVVSVFRKKHKKKLQAARNVVFVCTACKDIYEGNPGEVQLCPVCHRRAMETPVRYQEWEAMDKADQANLKKSWNLQ